MRVVAYVAAYHAAILTGAAAFEMGSNFNMMSPLTQTTPTTFLHASAGLDELPTLNVDNELPPVLQHLVDERREFEMNLGKAMDTLRKDYPMILKKKPGTFISYLYFSYFHYLELVSNMEVFLFPSDFSIYHEDIQVTDPSGVQVKKLNGYKNSFRFLQTIVGLLYNTDRSTVQNRMVYDFARQSIRVSWNAMLVPKIVGNKRNSLYIDGISIYNIDAESGKIIEHRIENMLINNTPVRPPYGVLSTLSQELTANRQQVPVGVGAMIDFH